MLLLLKKKRIVLEGDIPSPLNAPSGCSFRTRCPYASEECANKVPTLESAGSRHEVSCLFWKDIDEGKRTK